MSREQRNSKAFAWPDDRRLCRISSPGRVFDFDDVDRSKALQSVFQDDLRPVKLCRVVAFT